MNEEDGTNQLVILSAAGAIIVLTLCLLGATANIAVQFTDKMILGVALIAIYSFGISLAIRPGWIRRIRKNDVHGADASSLRPSGRTRRGHHPDCENFKGHTVNIGGKPYCAGCIGLAAGAIISIGLACSYVAFAPKMPLPISMTLVGLGTAFVGGTLLVNELLDVAGGTRLATNSLLSLGFLLAPVGLLDSTGNIAYGLVGVIISFLWLDTRIRLSRRRHRRLCIECRETCKSY